MQQTNQESLNSKPNPQSNIIQSDIKEAYNKEHNTYDFTAEELHKSNLGQEKKYIYLNILI